MIPLEASPLVEWHYGELADVPSFTVLKAQICVTRPLLCVNFDKTFRELPPNVSANPNAQPSPVKAR